MEKLIRTDKETGKKEIFFLGEMPVSIGRSAESAIAIDDEFISWTHARIERRAKGDVWIIDCGSRNGTSVNGERISDSPIVDGDRINLGGQLVLTYQGGVQRGQKGGAPAGETQEKKGAAIGEKAVEAGKEQAVRPPPKPLTPPKPPKPALSKSATALPELARWGGKGGQAPLQNEAVGPPKAGRQDPLATGKEPLGKEGQKPGATGGGEARKEVSLAEFVEGKRTADTAPRLDSTDAKEGFQQRKVLPSPSSPPSAKEPDPPSGGTVEPSQAGASGEGKKTARPLRPIAAPAASKGKEGTGSESAPAATKEDRASHEQALQSKIAGTGPVAWAALSEVRRRELEKEIAGLESRIGRLGEEERKREKAKKSIGKEIGESEAKLKKQSAEHERLLKEIASLEEVKSALKKERVELEKGVPEQKQRLSVLGEEISVKEEEKARLGQEISGLDEELKAKAWECEKLTQGKKGLAEERDKLSEEKERISEERDHLSEEKWILGEETGAARTKLKALDGELRGREERLADAGEKLKELAEAEAKFEGLEAEALSVGATLEKLRQEEAELGEKIRSGRAELEGLASDREEASSLRAEKKELDAAVESAGSELAALREEMEALREEAKGLREKNGAAAKEYDGAKQALEDRQAEEKREREALEAVRQERSEIEAALGDMKDVRADLVVCRGEVKEAQEQRASVLGEIDRLREEVASLNEEAGSLRERQEEISELENVKIGIGEELLKLDLRANEQRGRLEEGKERLAAGEEDLANIEARREEVAKELGRLQEELVQGKLESEAAGLALEQLKEVSAQKKLVQEELSSLEAHRKEIEGQVAAIGREKEEGEKELAKMGEERVKGEAALSADGKARDALLDEIEQLREELDDLANGKEKTIGESARIREELLDLKGRRDTVKDDLGRLEEGLGAKREELGASRAELEILVGRLSEMRAERKKLFDEREELVRLRGDRASLEEEIAASGERLEGTKKELSGLRKQVEEIRKSDLVMHNLRELAEQFKVHGEVIEQEMEVRRRELEERSREAEELLSAISDARRVQQGIEEQAAEADSLVDGREQHLSNLDDALNERRDELARLTSARDDLIQVIHDLKLEVSERVGERDGPGIGRETSPAAEGGSRSGPAIPSVETGDAERGAGGFYVSMPGAPDSSGLRDSDRSLFSRRPASTGGNERRARGASPGTGRGTEGRIDVLNLTGAGVVGSAPIGFWDASGQEAIPVGMHGLGIATGGAIHTDTGSAIAEGNAVLVVSGTDLDLTLEAVDAIGGAGLPVLVSWPECDSGWLADAASEDGSRSRIGRILEQADVALTSCRSEIDLFEACARGASRAFFPAPYPLAHPDWDASRGPEKRAGILLGGFPFSGGDEGNSFCRETLQMAARVSLQTGERIATFGALAPTQGSLLESAGVDLANVQIVAIPASFSRYIGVLSKHLLVFDHSRQARRLGSLAGDVLLTRGICCGGGSDLDRLLFAETCGSVGAEKIDQVVDKICELAGDPVSFSEVASQAARKALSEISFEASSSHVREILRVLKEDASGLPAGSLMH